MLGFITEIALDIQEFFFQRKKKKRREFEKKHGLSKKFMLSPNNRFFILFIILISIITYSIFFSFSNKEELTLQKLKIIKELLKSEKDVLDTYPKELKTIIRNNPLNKGITLDNWGNEFHYAQLENGNKYVLFSSGKDGEINTSDDIYE